jgi:hypothetical protein
VEVNGLNKTIAYANGVNLLLHNINRKKRMTQKVYTSTNKLGKAIPVTGRGGP